MAIKEINLEELKLNKLFLLLRKKRALFAIILLLVLLAGGIMTIEYYNKEFLIKHILINDFLNKTFFDPHPYVNYFESDSLLELCQKTSFFIFLTPVLIPLSIWNFYTYYINYIQIEEEKNLFLKKHKVYSVSGLGTSRFYSIKLAININNFKKFWLYSGHEELLPIQKAIKNFNEMIIAEKININSYEECLEIIKIFVKLIHDGYEELILKEEDEFITELFSVERPGQKPRKIEYRAKAPFIFKKPGYPYDGGSEQEDYYVELHIGYPQTPTVTEKWTFKVKKNGEIYDFNKIIFSESFPSP